MNTLRPMARKRNLIERALLHPYFPRIRIAALTAIAAAAILYPKSCGESYHASISPLQKASEERVQETENHTNPLEGLVQSLEGLVQNQGLIAEASHHTAPPNHTFNKALLRVTRYNSFIAESSRDYKIPVDLLTAMAIVESEGNPRAVSPKGARGLLQVTPETAALFNISKDELFDPRLNLRTGSAYLLTLMRRFEDPVLALMGYNGGPEKIERIRRSLGVFNKTATLENLREREDLPRETKEYIPKVLSVYAALQSRNAKKSPSQTQRASHSTANPAAYQAKGYKR